MPIPKPKRGEDKDAFIGRCISTLTKADPGRDPKQIQAICFDTWKRAKGGSQMAENKRKDWRFLEYLVPIQESVEVGDDYVIRGVAITETTTRNNHKFVASELKKAAPSLKNKPLLKDHDNSVDSIVGRVTNKVKFDEETKSINFEAKVMDRLMKDMINDGRITSVSVGAVVEDMDIEGKDGDDENQVLVARGIEFVELSLVAVPADPNAGFAAAMEESFKLKQKRLKRLKSFKKKKSEVKKMVKKKVKEENEAQPEAEDKKEEETPKEEVKKEEETPKEEDKTSEEMAKLEEENKRLKEELLRKENEMLKKKLEEQDEEETPKEEVKKEEETTDETKGDVKPEEEETKEESFKIERSDGGKGYSIYKESYEDTDLKRLRRGE